MMLMPRRDFDLFDDIFSDPFFRGESKQMRTDIKETKNNYVIEVDLPGFDKKDINVSVNDGYLTVSAEKDSTKEEKDDDEEKYVRKERFYGSCQRSFYVGDTIDTEDVKASFHNGTLKLEVPKKDEKEKLPEKKYVQIEG